MSMQWGEGMGTGGWKGNGDPQAGNFFIFGVIVVGMSNEGRSSNKYLAFF